jgi:hypothetical protein
MESELRNVNREAMWYQSNRVEEIILQIFN